MLKTVGGFRYIEALCPLSWKVYGNESTVQTCMDQILTLQRDARAGVPLMIRSDSTNGTASVRRTILAGIWVAFFQECQQSSCGQEQAYFDFSLAVFLMFAEKYSYCKRVTLSRLVARSRLANRTARHHCRRSRVARQGRMVRTALLPVVPGL